MKINNSIKWFALLELVISVWMLFIISTVLFTLFFSNKVNSNYPDLYLIDKSVKDFNDYSINWYFNDNYWIDEIKNRLPSFYWITFNVWDSLFYKNTIQEREDDLQEDYFRIISKDIDEFNSRWLIIWKIIAKETNLSNTFTELNNVSLLYSNSTTWNTLVYVNNNDFIEWNRKILDNDIEWTINEFEEPENNIEFKYFKIYFNSSQWEYEYFIDLENKDSWFEKLILPESKIEDNNEDSLIVKSSHLINNTQKSIEKTQAIYAAKSSLNESLSMISWIKDSDSIDMYEDASLDIESDNIEYTSNRNWYFNLMLNKNVSYEISSWNAYWWDFNFKYFNNEDLFDTLNLNFNKLNSSEDIVIEIYKEELELNVKKCSIKNYLTCNYINKTVIYTWDNTLNWVSQDWYYINYTSWDWDYNNKVVIEWFDLNNYIYRVNYYTPNFKKIDFNVYVTKNWERRAITNNLVEIESTWYSFDWYSKIKLQKKLVHSTQPVYNYVLFSDEIISK